MALRLSRALAGQLRALAARAAEECGLLLCDGEGTVRFQHTTNVAEDRSCAFEIDPDALIAALKRDRLGQEKLLGYFHTHPCGTARPSAVDLAGAPADGRWWLIASADELRLWRLEDGGFVEHALELLDDKCVSLDTDAL